jgi:ZIP family zinc transporter
VLEAAFWSLVASSSLFVGAAIALRFSLSQKTIGLIMGFGAGVLIAALSVDLAADAFERTNGLVLGLGLAAGGVTFFIGDLLLDRYGGEGRKSSGGAQAGGGALAIVLGIVLDGIPESAAIGVTLLEGTGIGAAFVIAVFLSNLPEALSATSGLAMSGWSRGRIFGLWALVAAVCTLASVLAFGLLDESNQTLIGFILAFAAGAILAMLADTMMPEAFEHAGKVVALVTVLGFAVGFVIVEREVGEAAPAPHVTVMTREARGYRASSFASIAERRSPISASMSRTSCSAASSRSSSSARTSDCSVETNADVTVAVRKEMNVTPKMMRTLPTTRPVVVVGTRSP